MHRSKFLALAALLSAGAACNSGRYSAAGFHLPADGDVARGKAAFVELGCATCHEVSGGGLPQPTIQPPVPVILGGEVNRRLSDGYLVTSMMDPSYRLAPYPKDQITVAGHSRMPQYADRMTARQLIDVVAFLQAQYTVRQNMPTYVYH